MNVLVVDVDSTIANLALMHISAFHKASGDTVALTHGSGSVPLDAGFHVPDIVYVSCVFTWNVGNAIRIASGWRSRGIETRIGGTGIDLHAKLQPEMEATEPDYTLYGYDYAIGFCVRGCNRKCQFCVVPTKEGRIDQNTYRHPSLWVPPWAKKAMLLDNDIALYDEWMHDEILKWFMDSGVRVSITQGYDIRCLTEKRAALLADLRPKSTSFNRTVLYTAWDYVGIEGWIRRGIPMLLNAGFKGREIRVYCIVGFDTTRDGDWYRFKVLTEEFGVWPFIMRYNNRNDDPWINAFSRWVNRGIHRFVPWEKYDGNPDLEWSYEPGRPRTRQHELTMVESHEIATSGAKAL